MLTSLLLVTLLSYTGAHQGPSPQNLSVSWKTDFKPQFSWIPTKSNCMYEIQLKTLDHGGRVTYAIQSLPAFSDYVVMGGGKLFFSVKATCDKTTSSPVFLNVSYPDLVSDLRCVHVLARRTNCSWQPSRVFRDVRFFYRFASSAKHLAECPSYTFSNGMKTGCSLPVVASNLHVLLNSTGEKDVIRNTFRFGNLPVSPPALNMSVTKYADKFIINWTAPEVLSLFVWKFNVSYIECDQAKTQHFHEVQSGKINRVPHCDYRVSVRAENERGNTPWSEPVSIEALTDTNLIAYFVVIPLFLSVLMVVTLVCYRKHRDVILPKVPEPRNLLDSNQNKVCDLFIPPEEEQICDVFIVQEGSTCATCRSSEDSLDTL